MKAGNVSYHISFISADGICKDLEGQYPAVGKWPASDIWSVWFKNDAAFYMGTVKNILILVIKQKNSVL